MSNEIRRVVNAPQPNPIRAIMADNSRAALRIEAQGILDMQPQLEMERRGFTHEQAAIVKQAVMQGALKIDGLRQISVEDQAGRKSLHYIGDDEGATWNRFMNPLMIGKFGDPKSFSAPKQWWQK
jgi:hypothetical protein